jgi:hypothetical protein
LRVLARGRDPEAGPHRRQRLHQQILPIGADQPKGALALAVGLPDRARRPQRLQPAEIAPGASSASKRRRQFGQRLAELEIAAKRRQKWVRVVMRA